MQLTRLLLILTLLPSVASTALQAQDAALLAALEEKLLTATELSLDFDLSATGAISVSIEGQLRKMGPTSIALSAKGNFAGQDVDLLVTLDDEIFTYGSRENPNSASPPVELWQSLVIGFTRMGILHNVANLSANAVPDHASGGVAQWVVVENVTMEVQSFAFDIVVSETPSGSATLNLDESGNPRSREQTVEFPTGTMHVVESYSNLRIGGY